MTIAVQKHAKLDYICQFYLSNFLVFLYFVPNILSRIVGFTCDELNFPGNTVNGKKVMSLIVWKFVISILRPKNFTSYEILRPILRAKNSNLWKILFGQIQKNLSRNPHHLKLGSIRYHFLTCSKHVKSAYRKR